MIDIAKCVQSNMDFYRYASAKLNDMIINMYAQAIEAKDSGEGNNASTIASTACILEGLRDVVEREFSDCMCQYGKGMKLYDAVIDNLNDKSKIIQDRDFILSYELAKSTLHNIAKEGGFIE